jgi:hypothetical protein
MPNFALIIGIDAYAPESGLSPLSGAVADARDFARWLIGSGWAAPEHVRLLCGADMLHDGEAPATSDAIAEALEDIRWQGRRATAGDRLYFFYAGHGLGIFNADLLLPQDIRAYSYSRKALPWSQLELWLRSTGFPTQFCFVDTCRSLPADRQVFVEARLPLDLQLEPHFPQELAQFVFHAVAHGARAYEGAAHGTFTQALLEGLMGAAAVGFDYATAERVVRFRALQDFLEREVWARSGGRQRCTCGGQMRGDPVLARLGPASQGEIRVGVEPQMAATQTQVELGSEEVPIPPQVRDQPPHTFHVMQGPMYTVTANAPGFTPKVGYSRARPSPDVVILRLFPVGSTIPATLGADTEDESKLALKLREPGMPVRLYNGAGELINLRTANARGIITVLLRPDRYRVVMSTPEGQVEQPILIAPGGAPSQITLAPPQRTSTPIDRLLNEVARGDPVALPLGHSQAGLVIMNDSPYTITPVRALNHRDQLDSALGLRGSAMQLVDSAYVGTPGLVELQITRNDRAGSASGHAAADFQLLVPMLPGHMTIVGFEKDFPRAAQIELLIAPATLARPQLADQRHLLIGQRFLQAGDPSNAALVLDALLDQPLGMALAGYARLALGDLYGAFQLGERLVASVPELYDGYLLLLVAAALAGSPPIPSDVWLPASGLPFVQTGLMSLLRLQHTGYAIGESKQAELRQLLDRVASNQFWMLINNEDQLIEQPIE